MNYSDLLTSHAANDSAYTFWATQVRARINDPRKRDLLAPLIKPHLLGGKRPSMEQWYYDIWDAPNIDIVDVRQTPIVDVVTEGIRTADGSTHVFDIIALATGFDSVTGGLKSIDIRGTNNLSLKAKWEDGILTHLGMTISQFPNLFMTYGPQAPTAFANGPSCVEAQADWIIGVLQDMRQEGKSRIEATEQAEKQWKEMVWEASKSRLTHEVRSSWNGANIPGKKIEPLNFAGGLPVYRDKIEEVRMGGMVGFEVN
jgi:cation diffusion facilitator CzcD-associated flavoprotein CzcO